MQTENLDQLQTSQLTSGNVSIYDSARHGFLPIEELREALKYRNLIVQLVRRDIVARYKRSVLGVAWTMLNPLGMMIVLTVVYSQLFKTVEGYPAYVLSGLIAWNFFSQTTSAAIGSLVWGGEFFQRIYVPRSVFAISAMGTGLVNLLLSFVPLLGVMIIAGVPIRASIIFFPIPIILLIFVSLGVGLLISSIAIYFPDIVEMYQIILQAWFFITPIVYPIDLLPEKLRSIITLNPLAPVINLFRAIIYEGKLPTSADLIPATLIALITIGIGWWIFARKSDEFAYRT